MSRPPDDRPPGVINLLEQNIVVLVVDRMADPVALGRFDSLPMTIELHSQQPTSSRRETLLHEVLHAIDWSTAGRTLPESAVQRLGAGLFQVMRRNPDLVRYLMEGADGW